MVSSWQVQSLRLIAVAYSGLLALFILRGEAGASNDFSYLGLLAGPPLLASALCVIVGLRNARYARRIAVEAGVVLLLYSAVGFYIGTFFIAPVAVVLLLTGVPPTWWEQLRRPL